MLISDSHQQQTPFRTIYRNLPYYLIKSLAKELFPDWAYTLFSRLSMLQRLF